MTGATSYPGLSRFSQVLLWLYCFSFAFDFKGAVGGSPAQLAFFVVAAVSGVLLAANLARGHIRPLLASSSFRTLLLWIAFLVLGLVPLIYYRIALGDYLRIILPFALCALSWLVVACIGLHQSVAVVLRPLYYAALASVVWTPVYILGVRRMPLSSMRYQIIGQGVLFLFGYLLARFVSGMRVRPVDVFALLISSTVVVLSITRSYLITAVCLLAVLPLWAWKNPGGTYRRVALRVAAYLLILVIGVGVAAAFRSDVLDSWVYRLTSSKVTVAGSTQSTSRTSTTKTTGATHTTGAASTASSVSGPVTTSPVTTSPVTTSPVTTATTQVKSQDTTTLTRVAEYSYQWKSMTSEPFSIVFGRGVGSRYKKDASYIPALSQAISMSHLTESEFFAGHSFWVYSVYSAGLVVGLIPPILFLLALWAAYRMTRRTAYGTAPPDDEAAARFLAAVCLFVLVAVLSGSFTSNPFSARFGAMVIGLMMGIAFAGFHPFGRRTPSAAGSGKAGG